jgi:hypothetical protein
MATDTYPTVLRSLMDARDPDMEWNGRGASMMIRHAMQTDAVPAAIQEEITALLDTALTEQSTVNAVGIAILTERVLYPRTK